MEENEKQNWHRVEESVHEDDTGVLIQALHVWESEWVNLKKYANLELLRNVVKDGIVLWRA